MAQRSKNFNGKIYKLWGNYSYKRMAQDVAKRVKSEGNLVRVSKSVDGWAVYYRK